MFGPHLFPISNTPSLTHQIIPKHCVPDLSHHPRKNSITGWAIVNIWPMPAYDVLRKAIQWGENKSITTQVITPIIPITRRMTSNIFMFFPKQ
jgi:hypothetical protein